MIWKYLFLNFRAIMGINISIVLLLLTNQKSEFLLSLFMQQLFSQLTKNFWEIKTSWQRRINKRDGLSPKDVEVCHRQQQTDVWCEFGGWTSYYWWWWLHSGSSPFTGVCLVVRTDINGSQSNVSKLPSVICTFSQGQYKEGVWQAKVAGPFGFEATCCHCDEK